VGNRPHRSEVNDANDPSPERVPITLNRFSGVMAGLVPAIDALFSLGCRGEGVDAAQASLRSLRTLGGKRGHDDGFAHRGPLPWMESGPRQASMAYERLPPNWKSGLRSAFGARRRYCSAPYTVIGGAGE
jgi:hypothetical protein